jgi:hypothetical protein
VARHVTFLTRLVFIWAALNGLAGVALLAFSLAAVTLALSPSGQPPGSEVAAGITAATLAVVGLSALAWAIIHLIAARGLSARRWWARSLALLLSAFDVLLLPLGTALALYSLWVLLQDDARRQFVQGGGSLVP